MSKARDLSREDRRMLVYLNILLNVQETDLTVIWTAWALIKPPSDLIAFLSTWADLCVQHLELIDLQDQHQAYISSTQLSKSTCRFPILPLYLMKVSTNFICSLSRWASTAGASPQATKYNIDYLLWAFQNQNLAICSRSRDSFADGVQLIPSCRLSSFTMVFIEL